jgi:enterochelin esterase-like enzyme
MSDLLERALREGTPLIDGDQATFVVQGPIPAGIIGDYNGWGGRGGSTSMVPAGEHLWCATVSLPRDGYVEYGLERHGGMFLDPLNPRVVSNGLGGKLNYFSMPEAVSAPTRQRLTVPRGTFIREVVSNPHQVVGGRRVVRLYRPPVPGPYPLLIVFDGGDYRRRAHLPKMLDLLVARGAIRPVALAMVENGRQARFMEYNCSDATLMFLVQGVIPLAARHLDLVDAASEPGVHGVVGASMGGLIALYAGLRMPQVFGHVLSQSGAFAFESMPPDFSVIHDLVAGEVRPIKVRLTWGSFEWLAAACRRMTITMQERGYALTSREYSGGHNFTAWGDDLWLGLQEMYRRDESA